MTDKFAGADWVKSALKKELSPLGAAVADLLGDLFLGIYHMSSTSLDKADWTNDFWIEVTISRHMSTFDDSLLTRLVVLSHDRMLRVELQGCGPGHMRAVFHKRETREGPLHKRMPTLETHISLIRRHYPRLEDPTA